MDKGLDTAARRLRSAAFQNIRGGGGNYAEEEVEMEWMFGEFYRVKADCQQLS